MGIGLLLRILLGLAGAYALLVALLYVLQGQLLFPRPSGEFAACPGIARLRYKVISEQVSGEVVRAYVRETEGARGWLLFFHGNGMSACDDLFDNGERQLRLPLNFAFIEYPGYLEAAPLPSEERLLANGLAAFDHVRARAGASAPVFIYGASLGSGVATYIASVRPVAGLVLRTPYTSLADVAARAYPFVPVRWLLKTPMRAEEWAATVTAPVLALHGDADRTIPLDIGRAQAARFKGAHRFVTIEGADHNDLADHDPTRYWGEVRGFIIDRLNAP